MIATKISDTFTDTDGTALTAHTMNVGSGWTASVGTHFIQSNKATPNSNNDSDLVLADAGVSDYQLDVDITAFHAGGWESDPNLAFRWQDTNNRWALQTTSSGNAISLYEVAVGVVTLRGSSSGISSGVTYAVRVILSGQSITVYYDGVLKITYTSAATALTATKLGLVTGKAGAVVTKATWDNLLVRQLPSRIVNVNQSVVNSVSY